jgi:IclR family mhp operon transcriptional activator
VTEVARAIGVPRTTSYRLLETLASEGYVEKQLHSDVYRLTSFVQRLSSGFSDNDLAVEVAKPLLRELGARIGWPLALATPRGKDMVVRVTTDYDTSLAIDRYMIGFTTPILHAPAGFCYLAFCDDTVREQVEQVARSSGRLPDVLSNDGVHLTRILNLVRARGYCHICFPEYREGGLAVPIMVGGKVVGGAVMRYIKSALKPSQIEGTYVPLMQQLAKDIAAAYETRVNERALQAKEAAPPCESRPAPGRPRSRPASVHSKETELRVS